MSASGGLGHVDRSLSSAEKYEARRKATQHTNMQDVKELTPEFFYLPDFLNNINSFDLGVSKNSGIRCAKVISLNVIIKLI